MPCMHCGRPVLKYVFHRCEIPMPAEPSKEAMAGEVIAALNEDCPHFGFGWPQRRCDQCLRAALDAWRDKALEEAATLADNEAREYADSAKQLDAGGRHDMGTNEIRCMRACEHVAVQIRSLRSAREEEGKWEAKEL